MSTSNKVRITVIIDDYNGLKSGYLKSYGFAALIEIEESKILFDSGTHGNDLLHNLHSHGVSPSELKAIILSHNHNDHVNGISAILKQNPEIPIYVHHLWDEPVNFQGLSIPIKNRVVINNARQCPELAAEAYITNTYYSEDYGGIYEQACIIATKNNGILICGCCHPGLNKFLTDLDALKIPRGLPLHLIGGMHGFRFKDERARKLFSRVKSIHLCHCTMYPQIFIKQFGKKVKEGIVGNSLIFN